jgi:hypothetical protein
MCHIVAALERAKILQDAPMSSVMIEIAASTAKESIVFCQSKSKT